VRDHDASGRNRDAGGDRAFYAEDLAVGEQAERDVIAYFRGIGKTHTLERWSRGVHPLPTPRYRRSHMELRACRMPDLYDPRKKVRVEVKWASEPSFTFVSGVFSTRISVAKWIDYQWLDKTEKGYDIWLCHIFESPDPPQVDLDRAGERASWVVPEVYPTGFYKTRLSSLEGSPGVTEDAQGEDMYIALSYLDCIASIEDFRAVIAKEQAA
jgi:hypothetical protein